MLVSISREERTRGFFATKTEFVIRYRIQLSELEAQNAVRVGIADQALLHLSYDPPKAYLVRDAFEGEEWFASFATLQGAAEFESILKEQLVHLKSHLEATESFGGAETFEL